MVATFEQRKIPRDSPDALSAVGVCMCGWEFYGPSIQSVKDSFEGFGRCPLCHSPLIVG